MKKIKNCAKELAFGGIVGAVNGFFGAGGGILCVPLLMKSGFERKSAHTNAVAVILPITLVSTLNYILNGNVKISDCLIFLPGGVVGSLLGTYLIRKISTPVLKRIFGVFLVWAGWRLLF